MKIVGIDPGKSGAVVALDRDPNNLGRLLAHSRAEAAYVRGGEYSPKAMAELLSSLAPCTVILERQHPMPPFRDSEGKERRQGAATTFAIGYGYGLWVGVIAALGISTEVVSAVVWQREILRGIEGKGKARAVLAAERRCPALPLIEGRAKNPHVGLADACCLALYGLRVYGQASA